MCVLRGLNLSINGTIRFGLYARGAGVVPWLRQEGQCPRSVRQGNLHRLQKFV